MEDSVGLGDGEGVKAASSIREILSSADWSLDASPRTSAWRTLSSWRMESMGGSEDILGSCNGILVEGRGVIAYSDWKQAVSRKRDESVITKQCLYSSEIISTQTTYGVDTTLTTFDQRSVGGLGRRSDIC